MEVVTSRQNPLVRQFRRLAGRREPGERRILLEGAPLVADALEAGVRVTVAAFASRLVAERSAAGVEARRLADRLAERGARVVSVSGAVMAAMSPAETPSGVVALGEHGAVPVEEIFARAPALAVLLAGVQDPGNVGAVIRAAEALGGTGVVAAPGCADPFGWKAIRGSMGSALRLPVARAPAPATFAAARRRGATVLAAVPRGGRPAHQIDLVRPVLLVFGGEGAGLDPALVDRADERVSIPMVQPVESLNVAVAAAVLLYEASRQRRAAAG